MTADAQTQAMPYVPTTVVAVCGPEVPAPDPEAKDARTDWAQEMYEEGLSKLNALHERWAAALAEIGEAQERREPGDAAA